MDIDWSAISAGTSVISQAITLAKTLKESTSGTKDAAVVTDLLEKLFEAHIANLTTVSVAQDARAQLAELQRSLDERDRYALHAVAPGTYVYRFKKKDGDEEPEHFLCQACFDSGKKSVLQEGIDYSARYLRCVNVPQHKILLGPGKPLPRVAPMRHDF